jgi:hypothetical protein
MMENPTAEEEMPATPADTEQGTEDVVSCNWSSVTSFALA